VKVLYIHHCGVRGGSSNSLYYVLNELSKRDVAISIATEKGSVIDLYGRITNRILELPGVSTLFTAQGVGLWQTIYANLRTLRLRKYEQELIDWVRDEKPDLVHLNEVGMFSLAKRIKTQLHIPIVMHARTVPNRKFKWWISYFTRNINKYVDHLICISGSVAKYYEGVDSKSIIYNPIHINVDDKIAQASVAKRPMNVLYLANLLKTKGMEETMKAMEYFQHHEGIQFTIIGSNVRSRAFFDSLFGRVLDRLRLYEDYESKLRRFIEGNKISNVRILGQVSNIESELINSQVLIAPMRLNGTPRSVIEAGIHGIPSILALYDTIDDLIDHELNGLVIKEKKPDELIKAIQWIYDNPQAANDMGLQMSSKLKRVCSQPVVANRVLEVYKGLI
jgi:glycosyltransferase involved in cell wall biosynthesis